MLRSAAPSEWSITRFWVVFAPRSQDQVPGRGLHFLRRRSQKIPEAITTMRRRSLASISMSPMPTDAAKFDRHRAPATSKQLQHRATPQL
jgi:hypothetical protein